MKTITQYLQHVQSRVPVCVISLMLTAVRQICLATLSSDLVQSIFYVNLLAAIAEVIYMSHFSVTSFKKKNCIPTINRALLYTFLLNFVPGVIQVLRVQFVLRPFVKKVSKDELCLSVRNKLCLMTVSKQARL